MRFLYGIGLATLLLLHSATGLHAQLVQPFQAPDQSDQKLALRGKLKASLRFGYLKDNPEAQSLRERREFNQQGYPLIIYKFNESGQVQRKEEYSYDAGGTKITQAYIEQYSAASDLEESLFYRFDAANRLLEYKRESAKDGFYGLGNTYDPAGRLLIAQHFEKDRLPGGSEHYAYDTQGRCTTMTRFDLAGDLELVVGYARDAKGNVLTETHKMKGDFLLFSYRYQYDGAGRVIFKEKMGRSGEVSAWESFKYDPKGNVLEHKIMEPGETNPIIERSKYDAMGRLSEQKVMDHDGSLFQWYRYSYDSTGMGAGLQRLHADGSTSMEMITVFDNEDRRVSHRMKYMDGSGETNISYRYDESGMPMEEKHSETGQEQAVYWFVHERWKN